MKEQEFSFATPESGVITVGCSATENSVYFHGFTVYYEEGEQKTVASLTTTPKNSETVNLDANGASTVSANKLIYKVEYTDGTSDYAATINISPSDGATYVDDGNGNLALSFTKNGKYAVTVTADATHKSTINYVVTGIPTQEYELYTGAIVKGDYVIMSGDPDFTYALGNSVDAKSNRINNANNAPKVSSNKIVNPDSSLVWRIEKNGSYWTVKNISLNKYLASTANEKEAQLLSDASGNEALWSISYDKDWVFNNVARNTKSYLRNNNNYGWACYAIDTGNAPTLFKLPSTEPAIAVEVNGNLNLGVGETTQLTATKINGATGTVAWSADNNHVELSATIGDSITVAGRTEGTTNVTATLTDGSTVEPVVTAFTVTKKLSSIQVATAPNKTVYTEGEAFDKTGMVILATYDDGSTENPTDFTYTPDGALTPSDKKVTISWGGKTATQSITVNVKVVASISVNQAPTKARYHAGDDFDSTGLKIEVSYENEETAVITSGFVISPESYKFTSEDEVTGTKEFTVTYGGKLTTFTVTVEPPSGPIENGRYYIMNSDKTRGLNAAIATTSPKAVDLTVSNELTAFDVELKNDNEYEISITIDNVKYLLVCNTTATSSSNDKIRITDSSISGLKSTNWYLDNEGANTPGAYYAKMNTTGSTYRYLAYYESSSTQDWRGYTGKNGDQEIQFVKEDSYANAVATSLLNTVVCDGGVNAPSNTNWNDVSNAYSQVTIAHEKDLLVKGTANVDSENVIEKALAKYDYIVAKYNNGGTVTYNDFLGRNPSAAGASSKLVNTAISNMNTSAVVALVSMLSVGLAGSYCILRHKRKEQN